MDTELRPAPQKPRGLDQNITRIVSSIQRNGNAVTEDSIPFQDTGLWGASTAVIWKTSESPSKDSNTDSDFDGARRPGDRIGGFVCNNGTNFIMQDLAPGAEVPLHRSNTIDYIIMISGEIISASPDKDEDFRLKAGDILVRKADAHAYRNPGPEWARYAAIIIDAEPVKMDGRIWPEETPQFDAGPGNPSETKEARE